LQEYLPKLKEIRLLIGNTTDRETLETLAEGYRHLEAAREVVEDWRFRKRALQTQAAAEAIENMREALALMDQTDEDEAIVRTVLRLIEEGKLKVRVYTTPKAASIPRPISSTTARSISMMPKATSYRVKSRVSPSSAPPI
jgi:hypothetical protein